MYLREEMRRPAGDDLVRSYLELLDEAAPRSREHETPVVLQVDARRLGASVHQFRDRDPAKGPPISMLDAGARIACGVVTH